MNIKTKARLASYLKNPIVWLGIVAALLYSSWPLGYVLNPNVAHVAFASQLEASNQPYNWLFISLDILTGISLVIAGVIQWYKVKGLTVKLSILAYMIFAVLVIVAALVPFNCNSLAGQCYDAVHSPLFIIHGLASVISVVALLVSIIIVLKLLIEKRALHWINFIALLIIACWATIGVVAISKYHHADENLVQYAFISICSLSLVLPVVIIEHLSHLHTNHVKQT